VRSVAVMLNVTGLLRLTNSDEIPLAVIPSAARNLLLVAFTGKSRFLVASLCRKSPCRGTACRTP
jgi:hypothetical protein